jgi:hypothetical protein
MNRGRKYNAAIKGYRLLNERKATKTAGAPTKVHASPPSSIAPGDIFGKLTAIERAGDCVRPNGSLEERWTFQCECGARASAAPST